MSGKTKTKILVADTPEELEQKTADAATRPPVQVDIEDYTAGGQLKIQPDPLDSAGYPHDSYPAGKQDDRASVGALPDAAPEPLISPDGAADPEALNLLNAQRKKLYEGQRAAAAPHVPDVFPGARLTRYESRIRIVEAWQYPGKLSDAPAFVNRGWAAWGEWDEERKLEPGPALRVPVDSSAEPKECRVGDYVVRQEVTIALGIDPDVRLEVWHREEFEKLFLPSKPEPTSGALPPPPANVAGTNLDDKPATTGGST